MQLLKYPSNIHFEQILLTAQQHIQEQFIIYFIA